ncbi:hypothetical protein K1719_021158 [Acacia pycnantha]|nr:hypothetical protein K1719_021158 [Acacia pycnantha]
MEEETTGAQTLMNDEAQHPSKRKSNAERAQKEGSNRYQKRPVMANIQGDISRQREGSGPAPDHENNVIRSWGFRHWSRVEADGFKGGIWIVWERDDLLLDALVKEEQFFHCRIRIGDNHMLLTAVYASPNEQRRRGL